MHVAQRWAQFDLIGLAVAGQLADDDLDPPDWGLVTSLLGQAGESAGAIAGVAYSRLRDAHYYVQRLVATAREQNQPQARGLPDLAMRLGAQMLSEQNDIRRCLQECADGLLDALKVAQPEGMRILIPPDLDSAVSRQLRDGINDAEARARGRSQN
jgi:hypothetical protein